MVIFIVLYGFSCSEPVTVGFIWIYSSAEGIDPTIRKIWNLKSWVLLQLQYKKKKEEGKKK